MGSDGIGWCNMNWNHLKRLATVKVYGGVDHDGKHHRPRCDCPVETPHRKSWRDGWHEPSKTWYITWLHRLLISADGCWWLLMAAGNPSFSPSNSWKNLRHFSSFLFGIRWDKCIIVYLGFFTSLEQSSWQPSYLLGGSIRPPGLKKKPHRFHGRDRTIEPGEWPKNRNGDAKQLNIGIQCDLMGFNGIQWDIGYL
jgi:hypothetical protein